MQAAKPQQQQPQYQHQPHAGAPTSPATESFSLEADVETTLAVQRVFALVRNGEAGEPNGTPAPNLTLDDVVRFYNVRPWPLYNRNGEGTVLLQGGVRCGMHSRLFFFG